MKTVRVAALLVGILLIGCGVYDDKHVYGAYRLVSAADLRSATLAARGKDQDLKIYAYRVLGRGDIRVYITASESESGTYIDIRRTNGKWEEESRTLVWSEPID